MKIHEEIKVIESFVFPVLSFFYAMEEVSGIMDLGRFLGRRMKS